MALVIEDGSVVAAADSYVTISTADTYFDERKRLVDGVVTDPWVDLDDDIKESSLRYATEFIDKRYDWNGSQVDPDVQPFSWPRYEAWDEWKRRTYDSNEVPPRLIDAVMEAALENSVAFLNEVLARGGEVKKVQIGPIMEEYFNNANPERDYPYIDLLVKGMHNGLLVDPSGMMSELQRG